MSLKTRNPWVDALIAFHKDPDAVVMCPNCQRDRLRFEDLYVGPVKAERRLYCATCGAQNFARYSEPANPTAANSHDNETDSGRVP